MESADFDSDSDMNPQIFSKNPRISLGSADFNEIHSNLPDLNRETSNNERPLA